MVNKQTILISIDFAIVQIQEYVTKYNLPKEDVLVRDFLKILLLLKEEVKKEGIANERLLRGFKDICTSTAIQYEHTTFNDAIFDIYYKLENYFPGFSSLELLRMDFGKGDPI